MNPNLATPITPQEIQAITDNLVSTTQQSAQDIGTQAEARTAQLAPGLAIGSNAPGGYNYGRFVAPVVDPLTSSLVVQAQQNVLRNALREAQYAASQEYEDAQYAYRERQRAYQAAQAERNRQRRLRAEQEAARAAQAQIAALRNNQPIATTRGNANIVARPTQNLQVSAPSVPAGGLRVTQGSGLQGYGGIGNNAVLRVR